MHDEPDNVTPIKNGGKKKPRAASADPEVKKFPPAVLYRWISDAINRSPGSILPAFPKRLVIYSASAGMRVIGELGEGDVVTIHDNDVAAETAIMAYCNDALAGFDEFRLTAKAVREARDFWVLASNPLADVKAFRWLSETGYTFNRLPWDLHGAADLAATPTWDRLLARMTNRVALREWIGSLFAEDSDTHQYVWMFGQGGDGKGAINRFLARIFGGAYCAKQPPKGDGRFWTFGLIGKRLVAFPDCNDVKFVTSGLFKSLTGGDPVDMEAKGKMGFTYRPNAKYFFFSNEKPMISSEKADVRRIIYCEFEPQGKEAKSEPGFEERLWQEGGAFLTNCIVQYTEAHPRPGVIDCVEEQLYDHLSVVEERFEVIYEHHLCKPNAEYCTSSGLNKLGSASGKWEAIQAVSIVPRRMQQILRYYFRSNQGAGEFLKWLEIKHGVKKKTLVVLDEASKPFSPKVYVGVAESSNREPLENLVDGL